MTHLPSLLLLGAGGQLGRALHERLAHAFAVDAPPRAELDVLDAPALERAVLAKSPAILVNATAFGVQETERDPHTGFRVNALAPLALARAAEAAGALLVHFSTDFVFDGTLNRPYREDDLPAPLSLYGHAKLAGELAALSSPRAYVFRVESLFGGGRAHGSIDGLVAKLRRGETPRVFTDRVLTPTYVVDAAEAIARVLTLRPPPGLYHLTNAGEATFLEVLEEAARLLALPQRFEAVSQSSANLAPPRPLRTPLNGDRLASLGLGLPHWRDALARSCASALEYERKRNMMASCHPSFPPSPP
ncbi:MAG: NAD(P)-dependent oxidoreductase [Acidobacteria bacterium]|nr:NAD(P)-dependent oxidoreductase [Acidobacteriota bacterium]